jgi:hypothetical protein
MKSLDLTHMTEGLHQKFVTVVLRVSEDHKARAGVVLVQVVEPVNRVAQSEVRLGDQDNFSLLLLKVNGASLFLEFQILLDVFEDEESLLREKLIKTKGTLGFVDLLLKHLAEILYIDVRVLDDLVGCLTDKDDPVPSLMKQEVHHLKDKLRVDREEHLRTHG